MAEKAAMGHALVFTLTYRNNDLAEAPRGAEVFEYKHVQNFMKKVRKAYKKEYRETGEISYIIAGERGSQKDRVHWHMIIFSKQDLTRLGEWNRPWYYNPNNEKTKDLWIWDKWEHGHVDLKKPDQGGVAYVMKYALKDQFNEVKSRGTMRYSKSENHGASMFRMSKKPPIGARWLGEKLDRLDQMGAVVPKLEFKIPEYSGYWWPRGAIREDLLSRLHWINEKVRAETGRDAPQWTTLLLSVESLEKDWETLVYGQIEHPPFNAVFGLRPQEIKNRCGKLKICRACYDAKSDEEKTEYRRWFEVATRPKGKLSDIPENWTRFGFEPNPHCGNRALPIVKKAFLARPVRKFVEG